MTFAEWKPILLAWAQSDNGCRNRLAHARALVAGAMSRAGRPFVSLSGGKDSTVVTHLVLAQCPDVMVMHWDYGRFYIPRWLKAEIERNAAAIGVRNLRVETSPEYERLGRTAVNVLGRECIHKLLPQLRREGYDLGFTGIRAQESLKRRRNYPTPFYSMGGMRTCAPLLDWTWQDVWAYTFSNNLPYASIYERYAAAEGLENARFSTFFDNEFAFLGRANIDGVLMWRDRHRHGEPNGQTS